MQTIRLDIQLGGPDNYEVHISNLAKETGQRPPTPVAAVKRVISDSEGDDDEGDVNKPALKKKKVSRYQIQLFAMLIRRG